MADFTRIDFRKIKDIDSYHKLFEIMKNILNEEGYIYHYNGNYITIKLFLNSYYGYIDLTINETNICELLSHAVYDIQLIYDKENDSINIPSNIDSCFICNLLTDFINISNLLVTFSVNSTIFDILAEDSKCEIYFRDITYNIQELYSDSTRYNKFKESVNFVKNVLSDKRLQEYVKYIDEKFQRV